MERKETEKRKKEKKKRKGLYVSGLIGNINKPQYRHKLTTTELEIGSNTGKSWVSLCGNRVKPIHFFVRYEFQSYVLQKGSVVKKNPWKSEIKFLFQQRGCVLEAQTPSTAGGNMKPHFPLIPSPTEHLDDEMMFLGFSVDSFTLTSSKDAAHARTHKQKQTRFCMKKPHASMTTVKNAFML